MSLSFMHEFNSMNVVYGVILALLILPVLFHCFHSIKDIAYHRKDYKRFLQQNDAGIPTAITLLTLQTQGLIQTAGENKVKLRPANTDAATKYLKATSELGQVGDEVTKEMLTKALQLNTSKVERTIAEKRKERNSSTIYLYVFIVLIIATIVLAALWKDKTFAIYGIVPIFILAGSWERNNTNRQAIKTIIAMIERAHNGTEVPEPGTNEFDALCRIAKSDAFDVQ